LEWKPPIDPVTGEPAWDQSPPLKSPTKKHRWKRGAKADAVAAAGAGAAASALALSERDRTVAESTPEVAPTPDESPADTILPPGAGFEAPVLADDAKPKNNRNLLVVLLVVLVLAVAGIAYFAVKRHSDNTTTPTVASTPAVTPTHTASDRVLATSINLRGTDLPAGWRAIPATAQAPLPAPAVPAAAQVAAVGALSSCLGQPFSLLAGLFGNGSAPGLSASATSPMFQSGADPGISMVSTTSVMTTVAANRVLAAPFANPNFVACFTRYQTQLASAVVPGSTASVQTVTLPSPAGVTTFAYLTTSTLPGKGTYVLGEAFMFGGRVESRLVPSTNGPAVPQAAFAQAYDGVSGRVARAVRT
jgi:hypothetical protein